ncbi:SOS response-associated peptidase family protein [Novosphingobium flavum]|uniref:SOS response-associated peptidase family protein n=1 Tax=Novosphingobium flavum TaxID=1778672 RepID=A0A7X1FR33_9SPHN|nr:SOS response-associated peptidase family protein [Novosphingobium flavum]
MNFYRLDARADQIASALGADTNGDVWGGGDVAPGQYAPVVIRGQDGVRRMVPRQWGVPPPPRGEHVVTAVRNLASPFWIGTLRHTQFRCLVPVTRYLEGGSRPGAGAPRWFSLPSAPIFAFAGIWRDSEVASFAVLTTEANGPAARNRPGTMPVILHPEDYGLWLSGDWKLARRLAAPFPSQLMHCEPGRPTAL